MDAGRAIEKELTELSEKRRLLEDKVAELKGEIAKIHSEIQSFHSSWLGIDGAIRVLEKLKKEIDDVSDNLQS